MKIILSAPVPQIADAFERVFSGIENIELHKGPFETVEDFDCMVSAANSFGLMDGGVDAAITSFFGEQLQSRVQQRILNDYLGEQPVGTAFVIESGHSKHPWLIHSPTMRTPELIYGTDAVYRATWAALLAVYHHNLAGTGDRKISRMVFPAMGAGCGQVSPYSVAGQMALAFENFKFLPANINWDFALSRKNAVSHAVDMRPPGTGDHDHSYYLNQ